MATQAEIDAAANALRSYAEGLSWLAALAPYYVWDKGAADMIEAADGAKDQSPTGRQNAAAARLRIDVDSTGQGSMMSDEQCHHAAAICLAAVAKVREQR